ncbi:MAG: cupredoxin domain-containing protein [Patescibacteria group bacterium]
MKNIYIVIGVIVILGLLIFVYVKYINKGDYGTTTPTQTESQAIGQNTVTIKNFGFSPANLDVTKGTKVTWINEDSVDHTVISDDNKFNSGTISKGGKFEFTTTDVGTYSYHCSIHPNMTGQFIVR